MIRKNVKLKPWKVLSSERQIQDLRYVLVKTLYIAFSHLLSGNFYGKYLWPDKQGPRWGKPGGSVSCSSLISHTLSSSWGRRCCGSGMRSICASSSQKRRPSGTWSICRGSGHPWWYSSPEVPCKNTLENILVEITRRECSSLARVNQHTLTICQPPAFTLLSSIIGKYLTFSLSLCFGWFCLFEILFL